MLDTKQALRYLNECINKSMVEEIFSLFCDETVVVVRKVTLTKPFFCARSCYKHLAFVKLLIIHGNTMRYILLTSPFNRKATESLSNLFKDTQPLTRGADM